MLICFVPSFAVEGEQLTTFSGGSGTEIDPYQISTEADLGLV